MSVTVLPKTRLGKWSIVLAVASTLLLTTFQIGDALEHRVTLGSPIHWSLAFYAAGLTCMAALVMGIISLIKSRERSIIVFPITPIGLLALLYGLVIIVFAHAT